MKNIRYIFILMLTWMLYGTSFAQINNRALSVMDKTVQTFKADGGVSIQFEGSQQGELWLKDDKFKLKCNGIVSWFDGETQWTLMEEAQEVNVVSPTPDEIQTINPYSMISSYRQRFECSYKGVSRIDGKEVDIVLLTAKDKTGTIQKISLMISRMFRPVKMEIVDDNGNVQTIMVKEYKTGKKFRLSDFRFDPNQYPDVEIIDMR